MIAKFDGLLEERNLSYKLSDIMPRVLMAGGALGTSIFAMIALKKHLSKLYPIPLLPQHQIESFLYSLTLPKYITYFFFAVM
jgi:hypothetical protein